MYVYMLVNGKMPVRVYFSVTSVRPNGGYKKEWCVFAYISQFHCHSTLPHSITNPHTHTQSHCCTQMLPSIPFSFLLPYKEILHVIVHLILFWTLPFFVKC